jgi:glycogen operon protein
LPRHSVNFVTCHDGVTLNDLVSYDHKHNEANGENNRDGMDENFSWNCGAEGPTDDPAVLRLREQQVRNLLTTLLISQGVPMLLAGDEFLRTQRGNNNAWCQDNDTGWVHWDLDRRRTEFLRFARMAIALRKRHPALRRGTFFHGPGPDRALEPDILWHGTEPHQPDFSAGSRTLAFALDGSLTGRDPDRDFYVACNAWRTDLPFRIPRSPSGKPWRRVIDTSVPSPHDIVEPDAGIIVPVDTYYPVAAHSMIVLVSEA